MEELGVSQWREYGRERGFWDYFRGLFITSLLENCDKTGPIFLETICEDCKKEPPTKYEFECPTCKTKYKAEKYSLGDKSLFIYKIIS